MPFSPEKLQAARGNRTMDEVAFQVKQLPLKQARKFSGANISYHESGTRVPNANMVELYSIVYKKPIAYFFVRQCLDRE